MTKCKWHLEHADGSSWTDAEINARALRSVRPRFQHDCFFPLMRTNGDVILTNDLFEHVGVFDDPDMVVVFDE